MPALLGPVLRQGAFLFVVLVFFLVATLPAEFVYRHAAQPNAPLRLTDISGSVWSGHARYVTIDTVTLEGLDWQLSPWSLLTGNVDVDWQLAGSTGELQGTAKLADQVVQLSDLSGWTDMSLLSQQLRQQGIIVSGRLLLDIREVGLAQGRLTGLAGELEWQQATLVSPFTMQLGGFNAELSQQQGQVRAVLNDTGGPVELAGSVELFDLRSYSYDLQIAIRDATVPGLVEAFAALGRPDEQGRVRVRGSGRLF